MQSSRHYPNAPITEAIIEFQVAFDQVPTDETWNSIRAHVHDSYPTAEPVMLGAFQVHSTPQLTFNMSQTNTGFRYRSDDGTRAFQALTTGFTATRLRPYDNWERFKTEAQDLWAVYKQVARPHAVTRIALRYINRIELPGPTVDLQKYLRTSPEVADGFPNALTGFFMQLSMFQQDLSALLIVNETLLPAAAPSNDASGASVPNALPVILDIGLSREKQWDVDDDNVWDALDQLRDRKNQVFEASITDDARKLFS